MSPRIYIAGPISGRPVDVYTKAFREAQAALEAKGWEVGVPPRHPAARARGTVPGQLVWRGSGAGGGGAPPGGVLHAAKLAYERSRMERELGLRP